MSQISGRAASARENARQSDGKFGSYQLPDAGTDADLGSGDNPDHPSWETTWSPEKPEYVFASREEEELFSRGEDARDEAIRTGKPVPVHRGPVQTSHPDYDPEGGVYEYDCEDWGGDTSIGMEPTMRYTWATPDPEAPFVTVNATTYVDAFYTGEDGKERQLHRGEDHDAAVADCARRHNDWMEDYESAVAEYNETGTPYQGVLDREPVIRYSLNRRVETIWHTDVNDPSGSEVTFDTEYDDVPDQSFPSRDKAELAAAAHIKSFSREAFAPTTS